MEDNHGADNDNVVLYVDDGDDGKTTMILFFYGDDDDDDDGFGDGRQWKLLGVISSDHDEAGVTDETLEYSLVW